MFDENMTPEERIIKAAESLGFPAPNQADLDKIQLYHMEQQASANELYESAVADGINFATVDEEGDTFVNTKWLGMVIRTVAEAGAISGDLPEQTQRLAEILGQTIIAANKFVGKA